MTKSPLNQPHIEVESPFVSALSNLNALPLQIAFHVDTRHCAFRVLAGWLCGINFTSLCHLKHLDSWVSIRHADAWLNNEVKHKRSYEIKFCLSHVPKSDYWSVSGLKFYSFVQWRVMQPLTFDLWPDLRWPVCSFHLLTCISSLPPSLAPPLPPPPPLSFLLPGKSR